MKSISSALAIEKNKLATPNPWLVLLDITLTDSTCFFLVNNTEDVTFNGQVYTACPLDIQPPKESSKGEIPSAQLRISNATRVLQGYLEALTGGIGSSVLLRIVNAGLLEENYSDLEMTFYVLSCVCNAQWVTFNLGAPSPLRKRFPLYRYIASHCNWQYRGAECGYNGAIADCTRTLDDCRNHGNSARFGGFPGLQGGGLRIV